MTAARAHLLFALIIAASYLLQSIRTANGDHDALADSYEIINEYLEKTVDTDDAVANLAEAKRWLASESHHEQKDQNLLEALRLFTALEAILTPHRTLVGFSILAENERGLRSETRTSHGNYPLKRIDRVLEQFALKLFESEGSKYFLEQYDLSFCLKRNMYQVINNFLINNVRSDDLEANMAKAGELLEATTGSNKGSSALADALRLFFSLKFVTTKEMCNEEGYQITFRNNLAIPREKSQYFVRRIDKIINLYSIKSAMVCRPQYAEIFTNLIQQLDMHTSRSLRVFISESLLGHSNANETVQLQFKESLTTPELVGWYEDRAKEGDTAAIREPFVMSNQKLLEVLRSLVDDEHDQEFLISSGDGEREENFQVDEAKLDDLYKNYLETPCQKYLNTVGRTFIHLRNHWLIFHRIFGISDYYDEMELDMPRYAGLFIGRSLEPICRAIISNRSSYLLGLGQLAIADRKHSD